MFKLKAKKGGHERSRVSGRGPEQWWYEGERGSNGKGKTNWGGSWEARVEEGKLTLKSFVGAS